MKIRALMMAVSGSLLLCGCGEREEVEVEIGYRGPARANAFLAAERFLDELGWDVDSRPRLTELPEYDGAIMVARESINTQSTVDRLLRWVRTGGHLIYVVKNGKRSGDRDLDDFFEAIANADKDDLMLKELDVEMAESELNVPVTVDAGGYESTVEFSAQAGFRIPEWWVNDVTVYTSAGDVENPPLVSLRRGGGRVTLLADGHPLRNRQIDLQDHAQLLLAIASLTDYSDVFWFVSGTDVSFFELLRKYAWMPLTSLVLLVILWLWKNLPRFGPRLADVATGSMKFSEHLDMAGHFLWRRRNTEPLLGPMRRRLIREAKRAQGPQAEFSGDGEVIRRFAAHSGMDMERVRHAFEANNVKDSNQLVQIIKDLQKLESTL